MSKKESMKERLERLLLMQYQRNELKAEEICREIKANQQLLNHLIGYEINKAMESSSLTQRITKSEALRLSRDWTLLLNEYPELAEISNKTLSTGYLSVEEALRYSLDTHLTKSNLANQTLLSQALTQAYQDNFALICYKIQESSGIYSEVHNPHHIAQLITKSWVGHDNFISRFDKNKAKTLAALERIFRRGYAEGLSPQDLVKQAEKQLELSASMANRLVRTEMANIFGQATADAYELNEVEEYEILATLDTRTSEICQSLDGQRFKVADKRVGVNYPPFHPCCRTTTIPVIPRPERSTQKRWSKDADGFRHKVDNMTYGEWAKTYLK